MSMLKRVLDNTDTITYMAVESEVVMAGASITIVSLLIGISFLF